MNATIPPCGMCGTAGMYHSNEGSFCYSHWLDAPLAVQQLERAKLLFAEHEATKNKVLFLELRYTCKARDRYQLTTDSPIA